MLCIIHILTDILSLSDRNFNSKVFHVRDKTGGDDAAASDIPHRAAFPKPALRTPPQCVGADALSAAVGDEGALRMRHTPCGYIGPCRHSQTPPAARPTPVGAASCCGAQNLCAALTAASNFDRCHSFLLAVSATGGARKRPLLRCPKFVRRAGGCAAFFSVARHEKLCYDRGERQREGGSAWRVFSI